MRRPNTLAGLSSAMNSDVAPSAACSRSLKQVEKKSCRMDQNFSERNRTTCSTSGKNDTESITAHPRLLATKFFVPVAPHPDLSSSPERLARRGPQVPLHPGLGSRWLRQNHLTRDLGTIAVCKHLGSPGYLWMRRTMTLASSGPMFSPHWMCKARTLYPLSYAPAITATTTSQVLLTELDQSVGREPGSLCADPG